MDPLIPALRLTLVGTVLLGLVWPLALAAAVTVIDPSIARGLPVERDGRVVGLRHVGQPFTADRYLWGRPSAAATPYDGRASSGSNLGPSNPALTIAVRERARALAAAHPDAPAPPPIDLLTTSGSSLDPHIRPEAAAWQAGRIAAARGLTVPEVQTVIDRHTEGPWLGVFGAARVNVLAVNLDLDAPGRAGQGSP